jgi:hypothetical protein
MTFVSEVGATFVHDLPDLDEARYGRSGAFGIGAFEFAPAGITCETPSNVSPLPTNINGTNCTNDGYTDEFSWGYRMRFVLDYPDAFAGVNLSPVLAWTQDVTGNAPDPGGNFIEGRKSVGLTLNANYLNQYTASIGYSAFMGGGRYNMVNDRDNVSLSVGYSF